VGGSGLHCRTVPHKNHGNAIAREARFARCGIVVLYVSSGMFVQIAL
jgi:hypothetical protein